MNGEIKVIKKGNWKRRRKEIKKQRKRQRRKVEKKTKRTKIKIRATSISKSERKKPWTR